MLSWCLKRTSVLCIVTSIFIITNNKRLCAKKELVDKIVARVNGVNILKSDVDQRRISKSGQPFTLNELVTEELYVQKAVERKMWPNDTEIKRQIVNLKIHNGIGHLTDEEFKSELEQEGFTLQEYKYQLGRMLAGEKLKQAECNERVVVTKQEVEQYHKNNPEKIEEKYKLKMRELSEKEVDKSGKRVMLKGKDGLVCHNVGDSGWDDMGWVEKSNIDKRLAFVSTMQKGAVSKPVKIGATYHVVKLEDKTGARKKTLEERYADIERALQNQKKIQFEKEFESELKKKSFIVHLDSKENKL
jgi:parvulin-like peptidyl-prolyl isomerase